MEVGGEGEGIEKNWGRKRRIEMRRVGREGTIARESGEVILTENRSDPASTKRRQRSRQRA